MRQTGILLAVLMTLSFAASSALGQSTIPGDDFCPGGPCGEPQGDPNPPPPVIAPVIPRPPPSTNVSNIPSGASGTDGSGNNSGTNGNNDTANSAAPQGRAGASGLGTPGRSGNPSPAAPGIAPTPSSAGAKTTSAKPAAATTAKTPQGADSSGSARLPFTVIPSPFPALLEESPVPSPAPSASPADDLISALDDLETEPADEKSSWLPLIAVVAGIALLVMYLRGRRKSSSASRRGRVSGSRDYR